MTQRGQKINAILYSFVQYRAFDLLLSNEGFQHLRPCPVSVYVIENGRRHSNALCEVRQREEEIYRTNGNEATVYVERNRAKNKQQKTRAHFVLKLQGIASGRN